jgi:hypothetical protein
MVIQGGDLTVANTIFDGNTGGSGLMNRNSSSSRLINVVFINNSSDGAGGAIFNHYSAPLLTHVTFCGNTAGSSGGAIRNHEGEPTIINSILWGNNAPFAPGIYNQGKNATISHSLVEECGGSGAGWNPICGIDGGGNLDADARFVDAPKGNLRLWSSSPAIEAGNNAAVPAGVTTDLDCEPRIYGINVDMGAYEYQGPPTGIDDDPEDALLKTTALRSIYPNPFNPTLTVEFDLDRRRAIQMTIYDVGGRLVRKLLNEVRDAGTHKILWDGRDDAGSSVATGVYFVQVRSEGWSSQRKIVLLK